MESKKVVSNFFWRFAERCGAQGVAFVVQIVLARLLMPEVYGTVALVTVFTSILNVFVASGFGSALVQKKNADDLDFSTVFYFNITACTVLYLLLFAAAPLIARFYERPDLTPVVRVLGLTLVISGVKNIQHAYVSKTMQFKRFFFATLGGTVGAALIGIIMAYYGFGVWALVAQHLFNTLVDTIILWVTVKWRPKRMFSFERLKGLFSYGWKLLVASLISTLYTKLRQLIIGKRYTADNLAFYTKGDLFPSFFITNINSSIDSVLLPSMALEQDNPVRVKAMTRQAIKTSMYILTPCMVGLAAVAEPLVRLLLTEKWLPCVFYLRIFCLVYVLLPMQTANLNAIKAMGRSDSFLKLEIIKKLVGLTAMMATIFISVEVMACSYLITTVISTYINAYPSKKLIHYSIWEQVKDVAGYWAISAVMFVICSLVPLLGLPDILTIVIQVLAGCGVYIGCSVLFKVERFYYILDTVKQLFRKRG